MANGFYYARDQERHGPVPGSEIRRLIQLGALGANDMILPEGQTRWVAAGSVFSVGAPPAPPPPPPFPSTPTPPPSMPPPPRVVDISSLPPPLPMPPRAPSPPVAPPPPPSFAGEYFGLDDEGSRYRDGLSRQEYRRYALFFLLVPYGCALVGSYLYYAWMTHWPRRARQINALCWMIFGVHLLVGLLLGLLMMLIERANQTP